MTSELRKGRQAYVICPLIESSEHLEDVQNVVALYNRYKNMALKKLDYYMVN